MEEPQPEEIDADELEDDDSEESGSEVPMTVVALAGSIGEATWLCHVLDEAGIPASHEMPQPSMALTAGAVELRVFAPQPQLESAQQAIAQARNETKLRAHEDAFKAESIEESDETEFDNPERQTLERMTQWEPAEREARIRELLADWLTDGTDAAQIARHLAVAGFSQADAERIWKDVAAHSQEQIEAARGRQVQVGVYLALLGLLWFVAILASGLLIFLAFAGLVLSVAGILYAAYARTRPLSEFPSLPAREPHADGE
ncbi:MAG: hypothetical protein HS116_05585 [Planctomycetes bacterium]|nr:hypothetical protein [Planctomycetota bacterium]